MARKAHRRDGILGKIEIKERKSRAVSYARLSKAEKSDSIAHQKAIIREYVKQQKDIQIVLELEDYNKSGTNFCREGFLALKEAIKRHEVDCVIVKDLSRFGRNVQEVSEYLEWIFPRLDIRFISVLDGYDSKRDKDAKAMFLLQIKSLLHESYARDISRKIHTSIEVMQRRGEWIGGIPYGYRKEEKGVVVIAETAKVVQFIYQLASNGETDLAIANLLNQNGYATPREYQKKKVLYLIGGQQWSAKTIGYILRKVCVIIGIIKIEENRKAFDRDEITCQKPFLCI